MDIGTLAADMAAERAHFATQRARGASKDMLTTIDAIRKRAGLITRIALGVSMPHQIGYILSLSWSYIRFDSLTHLLESITLISLAIGVPIATDLLILSCVETLGAAAAARESKRKAMWIMAIPVLASGWVNAMAPAHPLVRVLAAFIVVMVPLAQSLRFIKTDFRAIERIETELLAELTPVQPPRQPRSAETLERMRITREWNRYQGMSRGEQRRYREEHGGAPQRPEKVMKKRVVGRATAPAEPTSQENADRAPVASATGTAA